MMMLLISSFLYRAASSFLSTLRIFPLSGRMAWNLRSLACFALPPAESPSTRKTSLSLKPAEQSASFPGSVDLVRTDLRRTSSRAFLAASAALNACIALFRMLPSVLGSDSSDSEMSSATTRSTILRTSGLPSRVLVCPSNSGFGTLTLMTAPRPSRQWSPDKLGSDSLRILDFRARVLSVRVRAALRPSMCVPPSVVLIELTNPRMLSENPSLHHCRAASTITPSIVLEA
mmetsp:Transcript_41800/g.99155  ORF Transcript_41800/g.99155 Transcript_41800/m.99155 type:complete len:231 (+) Transcript_41800:619-1311(+)